MTQRTWLITGVNSGFGRLMTEALLERGDRVAGTVRKLDAMDDLKKAEKDAVISQDEHKRLEGEVQKATDEAIKRVDEALKTKEQEIMQV